MFPLKRSSINHLIVRVISDLAIFSHAVETRSREKALKATEKYQRLRE